MGTTVVMTEAYGDAQTPADLLDLAFNGAHWRVAWSIASEDLNANLIVLQPGERIEIHRNDEIDVLIVGIGGSGEATIRGVAHRVTPMTAILIPRGAPRGLRALDLPFAYLTCHRRRPEIWPAQLHRSERARDEGHVGG